jgi:hypothetical protein
MPASGFATLDLPRPGSCLDFIQADSAAVCVAPGDAVLLVNRARANSSSLAA